MRVAASNPSSSGEVTAGAAVGTVAVDEPFLALPVDEIDELLFSFWMRGGFEDFLRFVCEVDGFGFGAVALVPVDRLVTPFGLTVVA